MPETTTRTPGNARRASASGPEDDHADSRERTASERARVEATRSLQATTDAARPDGAQPHRSSGRIPRGRLDPGALARRAFPPCTFYLQTLVERLEWRGIHACGFSELHRLHPAVL